MFIFCFTIASQEWNLALWTDCSSVLTTQAPGLESILPLISSDSPYKFQEICFPLAFLLSEPKRKGQKFPLCLHTHLFPRVELNRCSFWHTASLQPGRIALLLFTTLWGSIRYTDFPVHQHLLMLINRTGQETHTLPFKEHTGSFHYEWKIHSWLCTCLYRTSMLDNLLVFLQVSLPSPAFKTFSFFVSPAILGLYNIDLDNCCS